MGIFIRSIKENDYENIDKLISKLHNLHVKNRSDMYKHIEHIYTKKEFVEMVNNPNIIGIIAENDTSALGFCIISLREPSKDPVAVPIRKAFMESLYVDDEYRQKGIGRLLFDEALLRAKEKSAEKLELMVWQFNENAIEFYKGMGMEVQRTVMEKLI